MSLKDIGKDLQQKESHMSGREHNDTVYNVWNSDEKTEKENVEWNENEDKLEKDRKNSYMIGGIIIGVIAILLAGMFAFMYFQKGFFAQDRVYLNVISPETVDSNKLVEIAFEYKNDNRATLNDSQILVEFGDYFKPSENQDNFTRAGERQGVIKIGQINGDGSGRITLSGYFVGPTGSVDDIAGTLKYVPEKTSTRYEVTARSTTTIMSSPISVDINAPSEIVGGNLVDLIVDIKNSGSDVVSDLKLNFEAPAGFSKLESNPMETAENTWLINEIKPNSESKVIVKGVLDSTTGNVQTFRVTVGTQGGDSEYVEYASNKYSPRIVKSPINISHEIESDDDGVVSVGERLKYSINFSNEGDVPLRDAILSLRIETDALDFSKLELGGMGNFDEANKIITWKSSDVSALKTLNPKDSGVVHFTVPVHAKLPINSIDDYNFIIKTASALSSDDIPSKLQENKTAYGNILNTKVGAKVGFESNIKYKDGSEQLKVGEETVYSVSLDIDNINNNITDSVISIPLPTYIGFVGGSDDVIFNENANEVSWNVGEIKHGAGITSDSIKTSFDVRLTPSSEQVGKAPVIIKSQVLSAIDEFTNQKVRETAEKIISTQEPRGINENTVSQ